MPEEKKMPTRMEKAENGKTIYYCPECDTPLYPQGEDAWYACGKLDCGYTVTRQELDDAGGEEQKYPTHIEKNDAGKMLQCYCPECDHPLWYRQKDDILLCVEGECPYTVSREDLNKHLGIEEKPEKPFFTESPQTPRPIDVCPEKEPKRTTARVGNVEIDGDFHIEIKAEGSCSVMTIHSGKKDDAELEGLRKKYAAVNEANAGLMKSMEEMTTEVEKYGEGLEKAAKTLVAKETENKRLLGIIKELKEKIACLRG